MPAIRTSIQRSLWQARRSGRATEFQLVTIKAVTFFEHRMFRIIL